MNQFEAVTERIIEKLKAGDIPWRATFKGDIQMPMNFKSKHQYRGINLLNLIFNDHTCPYYLTFNQIKDMGGKLIDAKGKGIPIIFSKYIISEENGKKNIRPIYKRSTVFNLELTEGIDYPKDWLNTDNGEEFNPIEAAENIYCDISQKKLIPPVELSANLRCFYRRSEDKIYLPDRNKFIDPKTFYSVLFHEIIHSTGHESRLKRDFGKSPHDSAYAKEELVAEIGSCFINMLTGIGYDMIDDHAGYIEYYINHLKKDYSLLISAASKAQEALDYLQLSTNDIKEE